MPPAKKLACDLEEVHPHYFIIHNPAVRPIIKSEGTIRGNRFEQTGWRRAGMLARLNAQGFVALTLEDQIDRLPDLPRAEPVGEPRPQPLGGSARYSSFDARTLAWTPLEPPEQGSAFVLLRPGWVVRRRQGRGAASYYRVLPERSREGVNLVPLDATRALLHGYAQAVGDTRRPLQATRDGAAYYLPALDLPAPHLDLLKRFGQPTPATGWQVAERDFPLAQRLFARLGLRLEAPDI